MPFVPDGQQPTTMTAPAPPAAATPSVASSAAAPAPATQGGHFVPDPTPPSILNTVWEGYGKPGLKLAARTGIHAAAAPFDLAVAGAEALGGLAKRAGVPLAPDPTLLDNNGQPIAGLGASSRPLPSQELINNAGVQIDPNAGTAMKVADFVLPFLASGGRGAASRIAEAPGVVNKAAEGLGYVAGAGTDAGLSYLGGKLGDEYIGGPEGAFVGSLFGGGIRPTL